jgi:hypothetical protein
VTSEEERRGGGGGPEEEHEGFRGLPRGGPDRRAGGDSFSAWNYFVIV